MKLITLYRSLSLVDVQVAFRGVPINTSRLLAGLRGGVVVEPVLDLSEKHQVFDRHKAATLLPRRSRTMCSPPSATRSSVAANASRTELAVSLVIGCGSSSPTDFSPVHRRFLLADGPFGALCAGTSAHGPFFGQPDRPDQRCLGASIRPTGPPPGHSRSVLVACRGKGDASEMAVVTTTRLSGRAFWVALGATSGRGRLDRRRHRAGETLKTVGVCPLVGNAQRRWRES